MSSPARTRTTTTATADGKVRTEAERRAVPDEPDRQSAGAAAGGARPDPRARQPGAARDDRPAQRRASAYAGRQRAARRSLLDRHRARLGVELRQEHPGEPARAREGGAPLALGDGRDPARRGPAGAAADAASADQRL